MSNMRDFSPAMKALGQVIREHVAKAFGALAERMEAIEQKLNDLPVPKDGKSVTLDDVRPLVDEVAKSLNEQIAQFVTAIDDRVAGIPAPKNGIDGTSVKLEDVLPELQGQVERAIAALPVPKDGTSVTVDQVIEALTPALNSMHSAWALDFERRAQETFQRAIDRMPIPKDGNDGFSLDDFRAEIDEDGRTLFLAFERGDQKVHRHLQMPIPLYRDVFKEDRLYERGDAVTFAGSLWIAITDDVVGKPGDSTSWRLAVKHGRNGKDGVVKTISKPETVKL